MGEACPGRPVIWDHHPAALARFLEDLLVFLKDLPDVSSQTEAEAAEPKPRPRPFRIFLLDGLHDLGYPTTSRTLAQFVDARFGRTIPATQFGALSAQEQRAFSRHGPKSRSVWLCHGLHSSNFHPIKRVLARSDWPLEWRIVAPTSARVQFLRTTERLCELAQRAQDTARNPAALVALTLAHTRDLPGVREDEPGLEFARDATVARSLLRDLEPEDQRLRHEAAARLKTMPEVVQLFGVDE